MTSFSRLFAKLLRAGIATANQQFGAEATSSDRAESTIRQEKSVSQSRREISKQQIDEKQDSSFAYRRTLTGFLSVFLLITAGTFAMTTWMTDWVGSQSTRDFLIAGMTRIGLVFGAIWLAWDSLKRPARWLPPGLAVAGVIGIVVVAAQPKLILAIVPLLGGLAILSSILRAFRRR